MIPTGNEFVWFISGIVTGSSIIFFCWLKSDMHWTKALKEIVKEVMEK